jgi:thiol-disulfide isomerase/thioredoxin
MPLPLDFSVGRPVAKFAAKTTAGKAINFPGDYKGKIVLLDFWATWCTPCIYEFPHIREAQAKWGDKGFEVLSVSVDRKGQLEKLQKIMASQKVEWDLIYEGDGINAPLPAKYEVTSVPFALLVDGDTGKILATRKQLRGKGLSELIGKHLKQKNRAAESSDSAAR